MYDDSDDYGNFPMGCAYGLAISIFFWALAMIIFSLEL